MKRIPLALLVLAPSFALPLACGAGNGNLPPPPPPPPPSPIASGAPSATPPAEADAGAQPETPPPAPKPPEVNLAVGSAAPDPKPAPTVRFTAPHKDQSIAAADVDKFEVKLDVTNWKTAHCDAHVHVILDNHEYKAIYDTKKPIHFSELLKAGETLSEGQHVIVAFPSRATHESVKTPGALTVVPFWVGKPAAAKKGDASAFDPSKPMLIYSRPKGAYKGDMANHVLVDFQLANGKLEEGKDGKPGQHVHITVNGPGADNKTADAVKFGPPFYLDNLSDGSYTVKLELMGADNQVLPGPWNTAERTITVDHAATPDCAPGAPPSAH